MPYIQGTLLCVFYSCFLINVTRVISAVYINDGDNECKSCCGSVISTCDSDWCSF
jgi:hypothetical protein